MSDDRKLDRHAIKELSRETGRPISTLLALASCNDPFYAGATPASRADAEWFAELYDRFGFGRGAHLRRVHYRLVSQQEPILLPDGTPYENTQGCWEKLCVASKHARYVGLVPMDDFEDHRNPEPTLYLPEPMEEPTIHSNGGGDFSWLSLPSKLPNPPGLFLSAECPTASHIEIWCEKSTIDDVILPLARAYGLNVVTGIGELSVSACRDLVARAKANGGRPVRVVYVSDFDPAGRSMPVAVARKIEWFLRNLDDSLDIQLQPVVLMHEQCVEYSLPRTPIKETERRAEHFEARFGAGATELDAMEALFPGELRKILVHEIERFVDPSFRRRWFDAEQAARDALDEIADEVLSEHADDRAVLKARFDALRQQIEAEAKELDADLSNLNETIRDELMERARPILDDLEMPEPDDADEWEEPLFDSSRGYVEQIDAYKRFQGKPTGRKTKQSTE
ncbi:MAG: hypothetical protein ABSD90_12180 [Methylocystis sp.]|jgi:hypothetical protein